MAAEKVVPAVQIGGAAAAMTWRTRPEGMLWQGPIEIGAARVGQITLYANAHEERSWVFKLAHLGEEVYQWHTRAIGNHSNPPAGVRPERFPGKVKDDHEHLWVAGLDCACALAIDLSDRETYEHTFVAFCERTNTRCDVAFVPPPIQLTI